MKTIYLSSTYEDLKDHRQAVYKALNQSGYRVIAMENYVAQDNRPLEACLRDIDERAELYVGIFAFRYGYVPPDEHVQNCQYTSGQDDWTGLSITELEFSYANEIGLPCLVFVLREDSSWNVKHTDAYVERNEKNPGHHIDRLRQHLLQEKMASEFSSPHELASLVQAAVAKHIQAFGTRDTGGNKEAGQKEITWDVNKDGSPYPGLLHFSRQYAPVFFGREAEVREVLDRFHSHGPRFLIVSGDSGVGKSSFVEAGILPVLEQNGLPGQQDCSWVRMVPSGGSNPFDALMRALHTPAERAGLLPYQTGEALQDAPPKLPGVIGKIIAKGINHSALVLFLDQMEELFTSQAWEHAATFLAALCEAPQTEALWIIATIRSDHLHHCERHSALLPVLRGRGYYPLGPVDAMAMADMIQKPARCAGLKIPDHLVRRIVNASGTEPGSLPLLAFLLQRLFECREGNALSAQVYEDLGGVGGAIAEHVKTVEQKLRQDERVGAVLDDQLAKLFQSLLVVNAEGLPTRRRALRDDLMQDFGPLVDCLIKARLFTTEGHGQESTVAVSHEQLFNAWPTLAHWIAENQDDLWILRQAEIESCELERYEHSTDYLWRVDRLKRLQEILQRMDGPNIPDGVWRFAKPQQLLAERLGHPSLSLRERIEIEAYLSELGDTRPGVGLKDDGLPDIVWCEVLGGEITLEDYAGTFRVEPFFISKYPVTWIQYRAFLDAGDGYRNEGWWKAGLADRKEEPGAQSRRQGNHPAENVSWYDAVAYCRWLSDKLGYEIRLPMEWEWQQAATGGDQANTYPWGAEWESERVNTRESGLGRTTAVGLYPRGASPVGALDMSGNVWEWCLNPYESPNNMGLEGKERRVVRGGSWFYFQDDARAGYRDDFAPNFRDLNFGFRVCCASPIFRAADD